MRLAFYYISSCQNTLPEFRHLNTVRKQEVFEKNEYNLKKLIKYKYFISIFLLISKHLIFHGFTGISRTTGTSILDVHVTLVKHFTAN